MKFYSSINRQSARENLAVVSTQRGTSVVEIIVYLAVVGLVVAGVLGLAGFAFGTSKTKTETQNIQGIISGVSNVYGTQRNYPAGDMTATLANLKAAPAGIINGATLRNSWSGSITVTGAAANYTITDTQVPKRACVELAQLPVDPANVSVNGTASPDKPMDVTAATAACSAESNTIVWTLR